MDFFNQKQLDAMKTGVYICENCGSQMEFEDQWEDSLVCPNCGNSTDVDHYGFTDEEKAYFDQKAGKCTDWLYPTVTIRQIMWALKMKPLKKERWETVFDHGDI